MQNEGLFRGPARVGFLHKTFKFWSFGPYRGPHWSCSNLARVTPELEKKVEMVKMV
jgi:hypothetical protein